MAKVGAYENCGGGFRNLYFAQFPFGFGGEPRLGSYLSECGLGSFRSGDDWGLGRFAMGKSPLLPSVDSEASGWGVADCRGEVDFYSLRCLRHSRIAGIRGGRHSAIALGFPGKFMMSVCPATPATARERIAVGARGKLIHR